MIAAIGNGWISITEGYGVSESPIPRISPLWIAAALGP
jgi:hypothetical protein